MQCPVMEELEFGCPRLVCIARTGSINAGAGRRLRYRSEISGSRGLEFGSSPYAITLQPDAVAAVRPSFIAL